MKLWPRVFGGVLLLGAAGGLWGWRQGTVSKPMSPGAAHDPGLRSVPVQAVAPAGLPPRPPAEAASAEPLVGPVFEDYARRWKAKSAAPKPGTSPMATVQALYACADFFEERGAFDKPLTDHLAACFSPDLRAHFNRQRANLALWVANNKDTEPPPKLPMSEGSVFTGGYEGAQRYRTGLITVDHDQGRERARLLVHLEHDEDGQVYRWQDTVVLVKVGAVWLLDDVWFRTEGSPDTVSKEGLFTLRIKTEVQP